MAWSIICSSKAGRGLGVKHWELLNWALLSKWDLMILIEDDSTCHKVLSFKYANINALTLDPSYSINNLKSSLWWMDLRISLGSWGLDSNRFGKCISYKLGKWANVYFLTDYWVGVESLCLQFLVLFDFFLQGPRVKICESRSWLIGDWIWNVGENRVLLLEPSRRECVIIFSSSWTSFPHVPNMLDKFVWWCESRGIFSR